MNQSDRSRFAKVIDTAIAVFSPGRAVQREIARQKLEHHFRYAGAQSSRDRVRTGQNLQSPESSTYSRDRIQLMKEARDLEENGQISSAILGKFDAHVTGSIRYQPETGNKKTDAAIADWFKEWCKRCDNSERHSFRKLMQITLRTTLTDGDAGLVPFYNSDGEARLIGVEADRIGNPTQSISRPDYVNGIHLDVNNKAPRGFDVFKRSEYGHYSDPEFIPSSNFCHVANPNRFDRYRGISVFAPVIETAVDISEIVQFEKMAVKWGSMQTAVVSGSAGGPPSNQFFEDGTNEAGATQLTQEVNYGQITYLEGKDSKFEQFKNDRPGAAWEGFLQFLIHLYAAGVNLPYGFVFDIATAKGPGARFEAEQARRTFEVWQSILEEKALDKIKNMALIGAITKGEIPADANFMRGSWQFPRHPSIDVGRESAADVAEVKNGMKSMGTVLKKYALDGREERRRIAEETKHWLELSQELDVPVELLMGDRAKGYSEAKKPDPGKAESQKDANSKAFSQTLILGEQNQPAPQPPITVRTPVNVSIAQEPSAKAAVKKEISFIRSKGKITGAQLIETPVGGDSTSKKINLSKNKVTRIEDGTVIQIPKP
jgi:capsid protein